MSSWSFSKLIAYRYLWSRRSEAFISIISVISVLGVAIGVMVLTIVMAVMTGFETTLKEKIISTDSHVVVHRTGGKIPGWQQVVSQIEGVPGVASVSPFTYHQVLVKSDLRSAGVLIRGLAKGSASAKQVEQYMRGREGLEDLFSPAPITVRDHAGEESEAILPGIVLGRELVSTLGVNGGTPVSVLSPQVTSSPFGLVPKFRRFVVVGEYSSGLIEYESSVAYVALEEAQRFFGMGDSVSGLEVRVKDIDRAPQISQAILNTLGGLAAGYRTTDWTVSNKSLWDAIRLEKKVYFIVLLLIIVMASFSIVTTLIMLVLEKRRDIAVLKTMGASNRSIGRIFRIQGAVIGGVGTSLGLILGLLGCWALQEYGFPLDEKIFQMSKLPIRIEWLNFAVVGIAAFLICFLATIYPANRASALEPSDALRYE